MRKVLPRTLLRANAVAGANRALMKKLVPMKCHKAWSGLTTTWDNMETCTVVAITQHPDVPFRTQCGFSLVSTKESIVVRMQPVCHETSSSFLFARVMQPFEV
jgi:hypothetical protein